MQLSFKIYPLVLSYPSWKSMTGTPILVLSNTFQDCVFASLYPFSSAATLAPRWCVTTSFTCTRILYIARQATQWCCALYMYLTPCISFGFLISRSKLLTKKYSKAIRWKVLWETAFSILMHIWKMVDLSKVGWFIMLTLIAVEICFEPKLSCLYGNWQAAAFVSWETRTSPWLIYLK